MTPSPSMSDLIARMEEAEVGSREKRGSSGADIAMRGTNSLASSDAATSGRVRYGHIRIIYSGPAEFGQEGMALALREGARVMAEAKVGWGWGFAGFGGGQRYFLKRTKSGLSVWCTPPETSDLSG